MQVDLINTKILQFYANKNCKSVSSTLEKYFNANNTYDFLTIAKLLREELPKTAEVYNYEQYLRCYQKLLPIFLESEKVLASNGTLDVSSLHLTWLGYNYKYLLASLDDMNTATIATERILLLTSLLENALANVYFTATSGRTPPHLLRDLLSTTELSQVYGEEAILFLKVLLGTPNSINLRNIVWHGFPKPQQLPAYYVTTLILTIHSLGELMFKIEFTSAQRAQIVDFSIYTSKILDYMQLDNTAYPPHELENFLMSCAWLADDYKIYWRQLFCHYHQQRYWQFVILILPQIELLLRLRYGYMNAYDISAKLDEYYITMDTIFECDIPNCEGRKNKLFLRSDSVADEVVSEGALICMYDLFIAPHGPRLRDKVSHGEVELSAINNVALCSILLHLSMNLLTADEIKFPLKHFQSKFHLNALVQEALLVARAQLEQFMSIHVKNNERTSVGYDGLSGICGKIKIFQRAKREAEFMLLIEKNCVLLKQTCLNYAESINERLELLSRRELHSKRRRTLEQLLAALPEICQVLRKMLTCLECVYQRLQSDDTEFFVNAKACQQLLRFLKHTLKLNENLVKYADKNSNEWIKALELCRKFSALQEQFDIS